MALRVYNTLTRRKEEFRPLHGQRVSMFVCGITPHDHPHIGNARTFVAFDLVARYLRHRGYAVFYLQNVTDIEDRIIDKIASTGREWRDLIDEYWKEYLDLMNALRCDSVSLYARATDYMPEIIAQVEGLIAKGFAYVADGDVYFDTTTFPDWGRLSGQKVEELLPGARVAVDPRKRNPADFVLWKSRKPGEPSWESPWGPGRPGWHIEDTAITIHHFGPQYDLHGGATDLQFPHHEAEIAQAESFTGVKPFVRVWMHGGMLMIRGEEMHKSLGNFWSVRDALSRVSPEELRFYFLNAHYRSPIDFTLEGLDEAKSAYRRIREAFENLRAAKQKAGESGAADRALRAATDAALRGFMGAMDDDFNTREAIASVYGLVSAVNKALDTGVGQAAIEATMAAFSTFDEVLAVLPRAAADADRVLAGVLDFLVELREEARRRKDFATSDAIRARLADLGIAIEDTKDGQRWKRR